MNWTMEWWIDKVYRLKRVLPEKFRFQKLVPFVLVKDEGDIIEFV